MPDGFLKGRLSGVFYKLKKTKKCGIMLMPYK